MFNQASFIACIQEQLEQRGFGKNRTNELIARYKGLQSQFEKAGHNASDAAALASNKLFDELSVARKEKGKRLFKTLAVQASNAERIKQAADVDPNRFAMDGGGGEGVAYARAAASTSSPAASWSAPCAPGRHPSA
ncbi:hypothetical protein, partial [Tepidimonas sp.]|uniref:hypothetical protein n=1 Tax=Tepidimonas sp. TaxID=2002775 RepID=UPI003918CBB3